MKTLRRLLPNLELPRWQWGTRKLLLLLSHEGVYAQCWHGKQMVYASFFDNSSQQLAAFARLVRQYPYCCSILIDVAEEEFHYETIPPLSRSQRQKLLHRKQQQLYPQTPYHSWQLDHSKQKVVCSALTRPYLLQPWLEILQQCQLPLAGIYSLPLLSRQLSKNHEHLLLVSWQMNSGLRLSYCQHQQLRVSRLLSPAPEQKWSELLLQELPRTCAYLRSMGLLTTGQTLTIHIICREKDQQFLQSQLPISAELQYQWQLITPYDATHYWLYQLLNTTPRRHYSTDVLRRHYYAWWVLQQGNWLALITLVSCIVWVWQQQIEFEQQQKQHYQLQQQIHQLQRQQLELNRITPPTPVSASDIHHSVTVLKQWQQNNPQANHLLPQLSRVVEQFPQLELQQLSWNSQLPDSGQSASTQLRLEAELIDFQQDYRAALAYQQAFEHQLQQAGYRTRIIESTLNLDPNNPLTPPDPNTGLRLVIELTLS